MKVLKVLAIAASISIGPSMFAPALRAAEDPADRLSDAADVLHDMTRMDDKGIPQDLIDHATCVVVVPGLKKAGFIVGAKYGAGFAMCRKPGGGWSAPAAIKVEGGSVGFQIGASEQDVVLIVKNKKGEQKLLQDKFTIGGDASAAGGPVGRDLSAQTDAQMQAEILSYSRSRGLFAGISLEGATLRPDKDADRRLYGHDVTTKAVLAGAVPAPPAASSLVHALDRQSMHKEGM
jgi:lipid-binding SYLF domain-containing protein